MIIAEVRDVHLALFRIDVISVDDFPVVLLEREADEADAGEELAGGVDTPGAGPGARGT